MRMLMELLRTMIVSIECAFVSILIAIAAFRPEVFSALGSAIMRQSDVVKWLPALPVAICGLAFQWAWKLTVPIEKSGRELFDWPDYWKLKLRRNYSLLLSVVTAMIAISAWIFSAELGDFWLAVLITGSFGVTLINAGCMFNATLTIREITENQ